MNAFERKADKVALVGMAETTPGGVWTLCIGTTPMIEIIFSGGPYDGTIWTVPRPIAQVQYPKRGDTGWHTYEATDDKDEAGRLIMVYKG